MTNFVAALATQSDVVSGDYCDVSVLTATVINFREDNEGNEIPEYGMDGGVAMDAIDTTVLTSGDDADALTDADRILAENGWTRTGDWEASDNAYYADVERNA